MMLPCSLWSDSAWQALQTSKYLMAVKQVASASQMIWARVVLASFTATEQAVLASRVTQDQTALASLIDSVAWDSF